MIDKEAIEIMKDWIKYEKSNKDRINKADELIKIQETVLRIIDKKDNEIKELRRASNAKEEFYKTYMEENKKLKEELDKYKEMYAVSVADRVNSAFKQEHKNNEDLEMLYKGFQIELEEKNKIIDRMADFMWEYDCCSNLPEEYCQSCCNLGQGKQCIKEYFKKKVQKT